MKKYKKIVKKTNNSFLNLYEMDAINNKGNDFKYYFVSRNDEDSIKCKTKIVEPEGIVVYALLEDQPDKIVMIKQYRYPIDDFLYEFPAGLVDPQETTNQTAIREMKEETGLQFIPYDDGNSWFGRPFFMGAGFTDETSSTVYGYAKGTISDSFLEDTETIQVVIVDKQEAKRILKEEKLSMRASYLLMLFLQSNNESPFLFLK